MGSDRGGRQDVEIRMPADKGYVAALRSLSTALAAKCDLTVDEIEDLQIAVDEAAALVLPHARPDGWLLACFALHEGSLDVVVSVPAPQHAEPDRTGFSWTVLTALADRLDVTSADGQLAIGLTVQRETSHS